MKAYKKGRIAKRVGAIMLASVMVATIIIFVPEDSAGAASGRPTIKEVRGREVDEITLPMKFERFAGDRVKMRISVTNLRTGERVKLEKKRKLNGEGRVDVRVKDLEPGTEYRFRVRMRKENGSTYSRSSDERFGSTKLVGQ